MSVSFVVVVAVFVNYLTDGYAAAFELSFVDSPVHSSLPYLPGPAATHNSLFYASRVIYCLRGQQSYFCYQQILLSPFNSLLAL